MVIPVMSMGDYIMKRRIYEIPLYIVMLVPLVVYGKLVDTQLDGFPWFSDNALVLDIFLYHKQCAVICVSAVILLFIVVGAVRKTFAYNDLKSAFFRLLPLIMYVMLTVISSAVSAYHKYAWRGMMEQFESVWVIIGYFLICMYAYLACSRNVFIVFGVLSGVIGAIGMLQLLGADIYRTALMQKLCMPQNLTGIAYQITVERYRSYCSLSNPNYAGVLCCLIIPVLTALALQTRKRHEKILYWISDVFMFCSLIGSRSKSGILILAVCMSMLMIFYRKTYTGKTCISSKKMTIVLIGAIVTAMAASGTCAYWWGISTEKENTPDTRVSEIATNDENVKMVYNGKTIFFDVDYDAASLKEAVHMTDENGRIYSAAEDQGTLYPDDDELQPMTVSLVEYGDYTALEITDKEICWYFTDQTKDHTWYYLTHYGSPDKLVSDDIAVYSGLEGRERIVSGRGYIWSRTIPLIKKHIFLGSGQDSFAVVFPNNDYLGKAAWGYKDMLITKPHCMYMQTAVQSGAVSLTVLCVWWLCFLIRAVKGRSVLSKAFAAGILGYLLMGTVHDSNVGTAPVFWMLLGMGIRLCDDEKIE